MKRAKNFIFLAAAALTGIFAGTLVGCSNSDDFTSGRPENAVTVHLGAGATSAARTSAASTDSQEQCRFNAGDQVSISADGQDAVIYELEADGTTWTETVSGSHLYWKADTLTFSAYYPVTSGTSFDAFTLPADQSSVENIALADYMIRRQSITKPAGGNDITMELQRQMARVIIRISDFNNQYSADKKTVSNVRIYSPASGIADGNPTGSRKKVTPYQQGEGDVGTTYTALVTPGYANSAQYFVRMSDAEGSTKQVRGLPELEAGKSYTFSLTVGKDKIEVQSVTVQDWTTGETLAGGQAEELSVDYLSIPLTLKAVTDGTIIVTSPANGMGYSLNGADATLVVDGEAINVRAGDTVAFYGTATDYYATTIGGSAQVNIYGNIMSLLDKNDFATNTILPASGTFARLFYGYTTLLDASNLQLPATVLTNNCYKSMFNGCTSLTATPALPATTLAEWCYAYMFFLCTSLTAAPELPATTLADLCYFNMFFSCRSLSSVTCLATDISATMSTRSWLEEVAATGTFTKAAGANWTEGENGIPAGWTVTVLTNVVSGNVNLENLQVGDIIQGVTGVSGNVNGVTLKAGRYKKYDELIEDAGSALSKYDFQNFAADGYTITPGWGDFTPVDENGNDGNAWIVVDIDDNGPVIGGYIVQ